MLRAVPKGWFSAGYKVLEADTTIAIVDLSQWREAGTLTIDGSSYRMYREGVLSGSFLLESAGSILARATKPSTLFRSFLVEHAGGQYRLEAESVMLRKFILYAGDKQIGSVHPERALTRKAVIDLPEEIPLPARLFMFWLVVILWNRADSSSS